MFYSVFCSTFYNNCLRIFLRENSDSKHILTSLCFLYILHVLWCFSQPAIASIHWITFESIIHTYGRKKIESVQLLFPVYYVEIYPNLQHKYFHSLIIFVVMPGISSVLSRMASILCALFMSLTDSISLTLTDAIRLWMGFTWLLHFVREISIHLFRSH